jgi:tRNA threonylcarbamoyladenosine biosynthesis protein TsaB
VNILALETSTEACSVAIWQDGAVLERLEHGRQHSERILAMVQEVLDEAGTALARMDALAFGRGPGSFTGLRIGAGVAQGLAFGANIPVVPVSSLAALAQGLSAAQVLAVIDARMGQVYWGMCRRDADGFMRPVSPERVSAPAEVMLPDNDDWIGAGSGWDVYSEILLPRLRGSVSAWEPQRSPQARHVAELGAAGLRAGEAVSAELALPVYVRDDVAKKSAQRG